MATPRSYRVAEQVRTVVAEELIRSSDPRLELISITSVTTTADVREAYIYWTVHGGPDRKEVANAGLTSVRGRFRSILGKRLKMRFTPHLTFFYDDTLDAQDQVDELMARVAAKEGRELTDENAVDYTEDTTGEDTEETTLENAEANTKENNDR